MPMLHDLVAAPPAGLSNFRDLGGMPLGDRRLRPGLFLRCARPSGLSAQAIARLEGAGIAAIVDFRGVAERAAAPVEIGPILAARRVCLPVEPSVASRLRLLAAGGHPVPGAARAAMAASYRGYVRDNLDTFGAFLRLCGTARGPILFHCSAGKDRTGFAAALLLSALGASWDDIMADYLRTRSDWHVPDDIRAEAEGAQRAALLGVEPEYLRAAFEELDTHAGGAADFAIGCVGGAGAFRAFRERTTTALS
jgi:protein-tyrosine phosphatase